MQIQTGDSFGNTTCIVTHNGQTLVAALGSDWSQVRPGSLFTRKASNLIYQVVNVAFSPGLEEGGAALWRINLTGNYLGVDEDAAEYVIHIDFITINGISVPIWAHGDTEVETFLNRFCQSIAQAIGTGGGSATTGSDLGSEQGPVIQTESGQTIKTET
jgi:hypothetical protein